MPSPTEQAVSKERERCARIADEVAKEQANGPIFCLAVAVEIARRIRNGGRPQETA